MEALTLGDGRVSYRSDADEPLCLPGESLLRVRLAGICDTDLQLRSGYMGFAGIPGHEFVGEVVSVRFTGSVDHARVAELIAAMDVAVAPYLPSDAFYFSPIKVYEYMACGVPVVASNLGQIQTLDEANLLASVEPGDDAALATALEKALDTPDETAHRAQRAREWVRQARTWSANARHVVEVAAQCAARA